MQLFSRKSLIWILALFTLCGPVEQSAIAQETGFGPDARWGHVLIFDEARDQLLLFGGAHEKGGNFLSDTWVWKDDVWKKLDVPSPPARGFSAVAYHHERNTVVLHGGRGNDKVVYSDLWEWDGSGWRLLEAQSEYQADHHQMVYVPEKNFLLAFGGWNGVGVNDTTWKWKDGWRATDIDSPPGRAAHSMTYVPSNKSAILYGGLWVNGQYADVWQWKDGTWGTLAQPYDNSSLDHHSTTYDAKRDQIVGFGGKDYRGNMKGSTFTIKNALITPLSGKGPEPRHSSTLAYNSNQGITYMFGGKKYDGEKQLPMNDFWAWDGKVWTQLAPQSVEPQPSDYFDFWKQGTWESEITIYDSDTIPEKDHFVVQQLEHNNGFNEAWTIFVGDGEYVKTDVLRVYDSASSNWKLFYVDDLSSQVWDSKIVGDNIYFVKEFNFMGKTIYSRQSWSAQSKGRVLRTIDRSEDGVRWTNRYWQVFTHIK